MLAWPCSVGWTELDSQLLDPDGKAVRVTATKVAARDVAAEEAALPANARANPARPGAYRVGRPAGYRSCDVTYGAVTARVLPAAS